MGKREMVDCLLARFLGLGCDDTLGGVIVLDAVDNSFSSSKVLKF